MRRLAALPGKPASIASPCAVHATLFLSRLLGKCEGALAVLEGQFGRARPRIEYEKGAVHFARAPRHLRALRDRERTQDLLLGFVASAELLETGTRGI